MDRSARNLKLLLCTKSESTGRYFVKLLVDLLTTDQLQAEIPQYRFEFIRCASQEEALARLRQYGSEPDKEGLILLSDALVETVVDVAVVESWTPSYWAKEVRDAIGTSGITIAIMNVPIRVEDIDRTIGRSVSSRQLLDTLKLAADKLSYIARPEKRASLPSIDIRLIRHQHELLEYFRLRHRIYRIMGYLAEEIENAPSHMEIDWCDSIALHFGGYELLRGGRETLAGTARVVIASSEGQARYADLLARYKEWIVKLAAQDPVLDRTVSNQVLELELPIFHSQNLSSIFRQSVERDEVCGELSRVIVAEDYRGAGLSRLLVEFALQEAAKAGVNRLFLECLEMHEALYRQFGFQRMEGKRGSVIGVKKTMIAMELYPLATTRGASSPAATGPAESRGHV